MTGRIVLSTRPVRLPLTEPFVISRSTEDWFDVVEIGLTWAGQTGWGEATPVDFMGESTDSVVSFAAEVGGSLGDDPFALKNIERRLAEHPGNRAAKAGIDAALHDLVGKLVDRPVWQLLGLSRTSVPTTLTISLLDPDSMGRAAERGTSDGFRLLKLKLGGLDGLDLARVKAVRAASPLPLIVDVNEYWSLDEALDLIPELAALGVLYVEQPLPAGSTDGPTLHRSSELPIFVDEDCHTLADVARCAERARGINVKLAKSGGIREAIRMVHAARAMDLSVMLGCMGESSLGLAPACAIASLFDHVDLDGNLGLVADTWTGLAFDAGAQLPSDLPGLGVSRC